MNADWMNFPFITQANPFPPGLFVIKWCTWSSGTCDKLFLKHSKPLVLGFDSRPEDELDLDDSLRCCLTGVEVEIRLQIIPEPYCTKFFLVNLLLLELHLPPLILPLIELSLSLKKEEKHTVVKNYRKLGSHISGSM